MNIAEILKDCPKGTKFYSTVYGDVYLVEVRTNSGYPIVVKASDNMHKSFTSNGKLLNSFNGECTLFPSKENRDWSTFKKPKEYDFKPFDKVLVRDCDKDKWNLNLFSCINNDSNDWKYVCLMNVWKQCIPYEGNEHLLDTTNSPN